MATVADYQQQLAEIEADKQPSGFPRCDPRVGLHGVPSFRLSSNDNAHNIASAFTCFTQAVTDWAVPVPVPHVRLACSALDDWTARLLQRKIAFMESRLHTMHRLAAEVTACSLDGECSFQLADAIELAEAAQLQLQPPPSSIAGEQASTASSQVGTPICVCFTSICASLMQIVDALISGKHCLV